MQTQSESKTKIVPLNRHTSVVKIKPLPNGRIRISYHTAGTSVCLSDLRHQKTSTFSRLRKMAKTAASSLANFNHRVFSSSYSLSQVCTLCR